MSGTCERCGDVFEIASGDAGDPFTSVSVSFHDGNREDFALSVCQDCGDDILEELIALQEAGER